MPKITPPAVLLGCCLAAALPWSGCQPPEEKPPTPHPQAQASPPAPGVPDVSVPASGFARYDPAAIDRWRADPSWRGAAEADWRGRLPAALPGIAAPATSPAPVPLPMPQREQPAATAEPPAPSEAMARQQGPAPVVPTTPNTPAETFELISPQTANAAHPLPMPREGGGPAALAAQVFLDRAGFSPGVIDGRWGKNTDKAVFWLQVQAGIDPTGTLDAATWAQLARRAGTAPVAAQATVSAEDVAGPFVALPDDVYQQEKLACLCYSKLSELLAERHHTTGEVLAQLNPGLDLDRLAAGGRYWAPALIAGSDPTASGREKEREKMSPAARVVVSKTGFYTQALDAQGGIVFHAPSTLGSEYDPSASGRLEITGIAHDPTFHYQPTLFHDVDDAKPEAQLPAGPNSPVGVVWIDLSKPHHGIHGTAVPESIGYTSSHGCVRLTNWDAMRLAALVKTGVPVEFRE
jgi:lipoprotein-anchoring transpeptidase ErfK/SrfK